MSRRQARELPKIDIGGTLFYLDIRLHEFRQVDDFMNRISLDDELMKTENGYVVAFDTVTRSAFRGNADEFLTRIGKDVKEVHLPSLESMDPSGMQWLTEEWVENNPIINMIGYLGANPVRDKDVQLISDRIFQEPVKKPLLEKKRERKSKGKRL